MEAWYRYISTCNVDIFPLPVNCILHRILEIKQLLPNLIQSTYKYHVNIWYLNMVKYHSWYINDIIYNFINHCYMYKLSFIRVMISLELSFKSIIDLTWYIVHRSANFDQGIFVFIHYTMIRKLFWFSTILTFSKRLTIFSFLSFFKRNFIQWTGVNLFDS